MKLTGLRIAVTGGAGFIGSHLVDVLVRGNNQLIVFDNFATGTRDHLAQHSKSGLVSIVPGDVRDLTALETCFEGVDVVFHLATHCVRLSLVDPKTNHDVNATGTLNALIAAKTRKVKRFIYCSSSEVYGNAIQNSTLFREGSQKSPATVYGASKLVGEHYTLAFYRVHGLAGMVVRPFNTYGPRSHIEGPYGEVIPRFTILIRAGKRPLIFGDGQQTRDFTYVEDTASMIVEAAEKDELLGDELNIAHGREVSVLETARLISELHGVSFEPHFVSDRPGDVRRLGADVGKAKKLLKFNSTTEFRSGLKKYFDWLDTQNLDPSAIATKLAEKNWNLSS